MTDKNRLTGKTTRLADKYIQELFTTGKCHVVDHEPVFNNSEYLMDKILNRLNVEHFRGLFDEVKVDKKKSTITLKNFKDGI